MSSDHDSFLGAAERLANDIADSAVWFESRCSWMGARPGDESRPIGTVRIREALGPDLYDGTSGVALFLAEASVPLDDARLRRTALGALRHALDRADHIVPEQHDGLYAGQIGIAYAATRVAERLDDEAALNGASHLLRAWRRRGLHPACADVFAGRAGAVIGLVAMSELIDEPWVLDAAGDTGDALISDARKSSDGWSWSDPNDPTNHHLCGYSHGAAGVGHAMLELFGATRDARFRDAGEQAFAYEHSWFRRQSDSWPDLRGVARTAGTNVPAPAAASWCHGAPGIAVSRLRAERLASSPRTLREADAAVTITVKLARDLLRRTPDDFCLCHGAAGLADVLLYAATTQDDGQSADVAAAIGRLGIERLLVPRGEFPCGLPDGQTPGLFLGLAGIGLLYLRLACRDVASPLVIQRPGVVDTRRAPSIESIVNSTGGVP
jgi:lantibiotic modifying enzyme